jgi:UTP-glucose-1-phosphate uridylyltransferase
MSNTIFPSFETLDKIKNNQFNIVMALNELAMAIDEIQRIHVVGNTFHLSHAKDMINSVFNSLNEDNDA